MRMFRVSFVCKADNLSAVIDVISPEVEQVQIVEEGARDGVATPEPAPPVPAKRRRRSGAVQLSLGVAREFNEHGSACFKAFKEVYDKVAPGGFFTGDELERAFEASHHQASSVSHIMTYVVRKGYAVRAGRGRYQKPA